MTGAFAEFELRLSAVPPAGLRVIKAKIECDGNL
jgi:hypothetical protein